MNNDELPIEAVEFNKRLLERYRANILLSGLLSSGDGRKVATSWFDYLDDDTVEDTE